MMILPLHQILTMPQVLLPVLYLVLILAMALAGFVLFVKELREISFTKEALQIPRGSSFTAACVNPGMIFFTIACLALFVISFLS
ncbi:MAG: hypothetical protein Q4B44_03055, partial [Erysipelotrichaceae bacterium]|nr:hypothetical protein [Erysipelotrichaceae bacterium]